MKFMNLLQLLELINKLGPKFKEALPHLVALYKILAEAIQGPGAAGYSIPSTPSRTYLDVIAAGRANGADESDLYELANAVNALSND